MIIVGVYMVAPFLTARRGGHPKLDSCPSDGRVFCGPGGSNGIRRGVRSHLSTGNYRRVYHQAVEAAALTGLDLHGPHDLRSTYATLLEVGSIPPEKH